MSIATLPAAPVREPLPLPTPSVDLIVVGGVPGAGKTTAIAAATVALSGVTVLDPERIHRLIRDRVPTWVPYRGYRAAVHVGHTLAVVAQLLLGPRPGRHLVVHDPGTRRRRRRMFLRIADWRGWRTARVYLDVDQASARSGQLLRGRVLPPAAFGRHWHRWQQLRRELGHPAKQALRHSDVAPDILVGRAQAAEVIHRLCIGQRHSRTHEPEPPDPAATRRSAASTSCGASSGVDVERRRVAGPLSPRLYPALRAVQELRVLRRRSVRTGVRHEVLHRDRPDHATHENGEADDEHQPPGDESTHRDPLRPS